MSEPSDFGMTDWVLIDLKAPDQILTKAFVILADQTQFEGGINNKNKTSLVQWRRNRPTVLMLHANAGNVGHRLPLAKIFVQRCGFNVMAISYRGYGHSQGIPSETGILLDAQTAFDYLLSHPILSSTPIFLHGQSLGGAVAIGLATDHRNLDKIKGVVLENTFLNMVPPSFLDSFHNCLITFFFSFIKALIWFFKSSIRFFLALD